MSSNKSKARTHERVFDPVDYKPRSAKIHLKEHIILYLQEKLFNLEDRVSRLNIVRRFKGLLSESPNVRKFFLVMILLLVLEHYLISTSVRKLI